MAKKQADTPITGKHHRKGLIIGLAIGIPVLLGLITVLLFLLPFSPLRNQQQSNFQLVDPQYEAFQALDKASSEPIQVRFVNGFPRSVTARVQVGGMDSYESAIQFLTTYKDLYLQGNPDLALQFVRYKGELDEYVKLSQTYKNIPVFGGEIIVHAEKGEILSTLGALLTGTVNIEPVITSRQAELSALADAGLEEDSLLLVETRLEIFDRSIFDETATPEAHLVWHVFAMNAGAQYLVDAHTGGIIFRQANTDRGFDFEVWDANGSEGARTGCYWFTSNPDIVWDDDGLHLGPIVGEYTADREAMAAIENGRIVYNYFHLNFGRDSFDTNGGEIEIHVHADVPNAEFLYWPCEFIQFRDTWMSLDITAHEYTHGISAYEISSFGFASSTQPGALGESYADLFGAFLEGDWVMGSSKVLGAGPDRNLANPSSMGDPDMMPPVATSEDNGGVHTNSTIPSHAGYLFTTGGAYNGITIGPGLGVRKAQILVYSVFTDAMSYNSSFMDQRDATVRMAQSYAGACAGGNLLNPGRYGFTQQDVCTVKNAYASVGLGNPDLDCNCVDDPPAVGDRDRDGVPDNADNCPNTFNPLRSDIDRDGLGDACDTDRDGDQTPNYQDNCPDINNVQSQDWNRNNRGDACEDYDNDGIVDFADACFRIANPGREDIDSDNVPDACDDDMDGDGILNQADNCPRNNSQEITDTDGDGMGDVCDNCAYEPNFDPAHPETPQADADQDGYGDACDTDADNDGIPNKLDNCLNTHNPDQFDLDRNGIGTACDLQEALRTITPEVRQAILNPQPGILSTIVPLPDLPCMECISPHVYPSDLCFDLTLNGLGSSVGAFIISDGGQIAARGQGTSGDTILRFRPDGNTSYFLRFIYGPEIQSGEVINFGISLRPATCIRPFISEAMLNPQGDQSAAQPVIVQAIAKPDQAYYGQCTNNETTKVDFTVESTGESANIYRMVILYNFLDMAGIKANGTFLNLVKGDDGIYTGSLDVSEGAKATLSNNSGSLEYFTQALDLAGNILAESDPQLILIYPCRSPEEIQQPVLPSLQCDQLASSTTCGSYGCYWWTDNTCHATPESIPVSCLDFSGKYDQCKNAGCYWWSDEYTCADYPEPPDCSWYTNKDECTNMGCNWDGVSETCK